VSYNGSCGDGSIRRERAGATATGGCAILGTQSTPAITSVAELPPNAAGASAATLAWAQGTWTGGWVSSVVSAYGQGNPASGPGQGVSIWDLDNEPAWWDAVHRDVHPVPSMYDEVTQGGIGRRWRSRRGSDGAGERAGDRLLVELFLFEEGH